MPHEGFRSAGMMTKGRITSWSRVRGCGSGTCSGRRRYLADDDIDDLVGVDPDGVLEPSFVVIERVGYAVVGPSPICTVALVPDRYRSVGDLDDGGLAVEDLEGVEVDVDGVSVFGQVDESPDLGLAEHREEGGDVLEAYGDGPPPRFAGFVVALLDE